MLLEIPPKCVVVEIMASFRLCDTGHCECEALHPINSFNREATPHILACKEERCGELRVSDVEGLLASVRLGYLKELANAGF